MEPTAATILLESICEHPPEGVVITGVATDNRKVKPGFVFVAVRGERVDGHDYAKAACEAGAAFVVAEHGIEGVSARKTAVVPDVLDAMIAMGGNYRRQFSPLTVGVTGSVGKTTTKEFCAGVFSAFGDTLKTEGNQNNEIGMPNTLFRLTEDTSYAVVEMGMQNLGEIRKLALAARPDVAIITKIGVAHIETLGSIEAVLEAKLEIADGLPFGGPLVLNGDDERLWCAALPSGVRPVFAGIQNARCEVRALSIEKRGAGQGFLISDVQFGEHEVYIPALGLHNVENALLAYTAATRIGLNADAVAASLARYEPAGKRQRISTRGGVTLIEDYYNANPDSMKAALAILADTPTSGRRIAVVGDMRELGAAAEEAHLALGDEAAATGVRVLVTVGGLAALAAGRAKKSGVDTHVFETNADAAAFLRQAVQTGDSLLLKASRALQFEEIAEALTF